MLQKTPEWVEAQGKSGQKPQDVPGNEPPSKQPNEGALHLSACSRSCSWRRSCSRCSASRLASAAFRCRSCSCSSSFFFCSSSCWRRSSSCKARARWAPPQTAGATATTNPAPARGSHVNSLRDLECSGQESPGGSPRPLGMHSEGSTGTSGMWLRPLQSP